MAEPDAGRGGVVDRPFDPDWVELAIRFSRRFAPSGADADDLAQEALLRLLAQSRPVANPAPWLYVVVRRLAGRRRRQLASRADVAPPATIDPWPELELQLDAEALMAGLSPRGRAALAMAFAGCSETEMAAALGCSVKSLERSLHRARAALRARRRTQRGRAGAGEPGKSPPGG